MSEVMGQVQKDQKVKSEIQEVEKKIKNQNRQKDVLEVIGGLGMLTLAVLAPGTIKGIGIFRKMFKRPRDAESTYRAIQRLENKGHLRITKKNGRVRIELTDKGRIHLAQLGGSSAPKQKRWDGNWRMVIYDIAEKRRTKRKLLHEALSNTGFYRLQDSVWVYPHACDELVVMMRTEFQLGREVLYTVVKHLENDKALREHFGVSRE